MRKGFAAAFLASLGLAGCAYLPVPPDPIRILTSPAEVSVCRRLGSVGITRTDGTGPFSFSELTAVVPSRLAPGAPPLVPAAEIAGSNFAVRLNVMRDRALSRGATDLLLSRRRYRDWSYVEGTAYICRR